MGGERESFRQVGVRVRARHPCCFVTTVLYRADVGYRKGFVREFGRDRSTSPSGGSLPLCAGCRSELPADHQKSWTFVRMISRLVTTIWLCDNCLPKNPARCAVCASEPPLSRIPLCTECLFEY